MSDLHPPASTPAPSASAASPDPVDRSAEHGQLRMVATRFLRHRMAMASLTVLVLTVLFAFLGPLLWPWDHTVHREILPNQPPSWAHPFGTTNAGHDVLGQLMRGTQQTLKVALTVSVLATAFGALWGAVAGYYRGWIDAVMMRIVDVLMVVPLLVAVAAISGNVRGGTTWWAVALIIALFSWTTIARVVRGVVLSCGNRSSWKRPALPAPLTPASSSTTCSPTRPVPRSSPPPSSLPRRSCSKRACPSSVSASRHPTSPSA